MGLCLYIIKKIDAEYEERKVTNKTETFIERKRKRKKERKKERKKGTLCCFRQFS